jgi:hypothetical protein
MKQKEVVPMTRIRLLRDVETDMAVLKADREVLCNWPDAVRMERYGLAVILLTYEH